MCRHAGKFQDRRMARELGASMNAAAPDEVLPGEQQAGRVGKALGAVSRG